MPVHQPTEELIPAIGYIRVSLAREEMISPELQETSINLWAKINRRKIVKWVVDLDATGRNFKRKIMRAISYIEDGTAKEIAVWKYSRFGRNRHGNAINLERVERAGGQLESATEQVDARTAVGRFQRGILFEVAAFESDRAGEQWKETHSHRRSQGLPAMGRPRFGYEWHQRKLFNPDGSVVLQEERYEPHPVEGPIAAGLYERYNDGESFRSLAFWLNTNGFETVRGEKWSGKAVRRYLDSGFPAGYLRLHSGCPDSECHGNCRNYQLVKHPEKHHPVLVSEETWKRYLKRRAEYRSVAPRAHVASYPFTGLVRCGVCEGGTKRITYPSGDIQYGCILRHDRGTTACPGTRLKERSIKDGILTFLQEIVAAAAEESAEAEQGRIAAVSQGAAADERRREQLQTQVGRLERAISKHMKAYALNDADDQDGFLEKEYRETLRQLGEEKAGIMASLEEAATRERETEDLTSGQAEGVRVAVGLIAEWPTLPPARINFLLRQAIKSVTLRPHGSLNIYPAWSEDPWRWSAPKEDRAPSKASLVRLVAQRVREELPQATSQRISDELALQGVSASADYVRSVLSRDARLASVGSQKGSDQA
jgi:DNA invertase Pin-like site-specific DNA recombinase